MRSGPGGSYIERRADGWWVIETAITWTVKHGPYRWRWIAAIVQWLGAD